MDLWGIQIWILGDPAALKGWCLFLITTTRKIQSKKYLITAKSLLCGADGRNTRAAKQAEDSRRFCDSSFGTGAWLVIEVTGESVSDVLAIQSDSLYVFDQWCVARGQSRSRGPWQLLNLFVNQTAHERHPVKSIKTNLVAAVQLRAPWTLNPQWINDGFSKL